MTKLAITAAKSLAYNKRLAAVSFSGRWRLGANCHTAPPMFESPSRKCGYTRAYSTAGVEPLEDMDQHESAVFAKLKSELRPTELEDYHSQRELRQLLAVCGQEQRRTAQSGQGPLSLINTTCRFCIFLFEREACQTSPRHLCSPYYPTRVHKGSCTSNWYNGSKTLLQCLLLGSQFEPPLW